MCRTSIWSVCRCVQLIFCFSPRSCSGACIRYFRLTFMPCCGHLTFLERAYERYMRGSSVNLHNNIVSRLQSSWVFLISLWQLYLFSYTAIVYMALCETWARPPKTEFNPTRVPLSLPHFAVCVADKENLPVWTSDVQQTVSDGW